MPKLARAAINYGRGRAWPGLNSVRNLFSSHLFSYVSLAGGYGHERIWVTGNKGSLGMVKEEYG